MFVRKKRFARIAAVLCTFGVVLSVVLPAVAGKSEEAQLRSIGGAAAVDIFDEAADVAKNPSESVERKVAGPLVTVSKAALDALKNRNNFKPGVSPIDTILHGLDILGGGMNDISIYLDDAEVEPYLEFIVEYTTNSGEKVKTRSGIYYDEKEQYLFGRYDSGMWDTSFDYDVDDDMFVNPQHCWQRDYGFCRLYDIVARPMGYWYMTRRIKFNYGGKDWMFQIWKGIYGLSFRTGGEVGIYNKPPERHVEFYDCGTDAERMPISLKVYSQDNVYIDLEQDLTWWATGYASGPVELPWNVTLESKITFNDSGMRNAFVEAANDFRDINCTVDGMDVTMVW